MNLAAWVQRNGTVIGDRSAIAVGKTVYATHRQTALRVRSIAGYLRGKLRCAAGEHVGIISHNGAAYLEALFGIWHVLPTLESPASSNSAVPSRGPTAASITRIVFHVPWMNRKRNVNARAMM